MRKLKDLRIYVSCLEPTEHDALAAMEGAKGQQVTAKIADYVLEQLGHEGPSEANSDSRTVREARKIIGKSPASERERPDARDTPPRDLHMRS